jgi:hypothetical protein
LQGYVHCIVLGPPTPQYLQFSADSSLA